jgi:hypothetical protein
LKQNVETISISEKILTSDKVGNWKKIKKKRLAIPSFFVIF